MLLSFIFELPIPENTDHENKRLKVKNRGHVNTVHMTQKVKLNKLAKVNLV